MFDGNGFSGAKYQKKNDESISKTVLLCSKYMENT